jgi:2-dehydro-3-deoxyglucarate aldolase
MNRSLPFPRLCSRDLHPLIGTIVSLPDPRLLELAVLAGCDWLLVDCEHGAISLTEAGKLLAATAGRVPVLIRIPTNDEMFVKQALDAGADGIVCPQVNDESIASQLVAWAKYPPVGARSVGIGRAHGYGLAFQDYVATANETTSVVVQVESDLAVRNRQRIIEVRGVGGVLIGPYDLSGSMGKIGQVTSPPVQEAVTAVVNTCRRAGTPVGQFFGGPQAYMASPCRHQLDFVAIGIDTVLLASALREMVAAVRGIT